MEKEVNGTFYHEETCHEVIEVLENARLNPYNHTALEYEKEQLQKGNDEPIRSKYAAVIENVLSASAKGEIGFHAFISEIKTLLNGMENICNEFYKE